jgi:hypothetical protein
LKKTSKPHLVKARVTQAMKAAVTEAAASKGEGGEAEAIIVREALGEYLTHRGYLKPSLAKLPDKPMIVHGAALTKSGLSYSKSESAKRPAAPRKAKKK